MKTLGVNQPLQRGMATFIQGGHYERHLVQVRKQLLQHKEGYRAYLFQYLPSSCVISSPLGGLVLWIQIPGLNADQLANMCEQQGVLIRSGHLFSSRDYYQDCFRLNIGWPLNDNIKAQLLAVCQNCHTLMNSS